MHAALPTRIAIQARQRDIQYTSTYLACTHDETHYEDSAINALLVPSYQTNENYAAYTDSLGDSIMHHIKYLHTKSTGAMYRYQNEFVLKH